MLALQKQYKNIAYFYAIIGNIAQVGMLNCFKIITVAITPFHALMMRAFVLLMLNLAITRSQKYDVYIKEPFVFRHVLKRLLFSTSFAMLQFYCLKYLPVSTVNSLGNTSPIFAFFLEMLYFKISFKWIHLGLVFASFIGVLLVIQPAFLFGQIENKEENTFLYLLVLLAAACYAMTMIMIHDIAGKVKSTVNLHYSYMSHMFVSSLLVNIYPLQVVYQEINFKFFLFFAALIFFALVTQYMIFASMSLKKPSHLMPFGYLTVIISFVTDRVFFGTSFDTMSICGMILTSAGLLMKLFMADDEPSESHIEKVKDENGTIVE